MLVLGTSLEKGAEKAMGFMRTGEGWRDSLAGGR